MRKDPNTYDKISNKYDEYVESMRHRPPLERSIATAQQPFVPRPAEHSDMGKTVFNAIGVGIALLLLALAAYTFYVAGTWYGVVHNGAFVGYTLAGIFLSIAGLGGLAATLNHNFRVLTRPSSH